MADTSALLFNLKRREKAVSPAISTVILTSSIVTLLLVTMVFANNFLERRMIENEFSAMEQFMQTVGLQIDDVAWIPGRTQTIRYASRYGQVDFLNAALTYNVYVDDELLAKFDTGILLFNVPITVYSIGNNYHKHISPDSGNFTNANISAPTGYVLVVEKLGMHDGDYIRILVVPCIRVLNVTIGGTRYCKFYLPILEPGDHSRLSQSVTLTGKSISVKIKTGNSLKINVTFPRASEGFDLAFFDFNSDEYSPPDISSPVAVEFYTGNVTVSIGLHG